MRVTSIVSTVSLLLAFAVPVGTTCADVVSWNAYSDYHGYSQETPNVETATWQYLYNSNEGGTNSSYTLMPGYTTCGAGYNAWKTNDTWHFVGKDPSVSTELRVSPFADPDGTKEFRTAAIGWLSPIAGTVSASFSVTDGNDLSSYSMPTVFDGVTYWLFKSGVSTILASGVCVEGGATGVITIPNIPVNNGDKLYLQIGPGANSSGDLTGVNFSITQQVPEPATLAMAASAIVGLLAYAWRNRR